ncbi:MAG: hypothetical protein IH987_09475 [Planctomycetes bacterium]|nr:hypothetical protein [Planctomycetota bacterium]
MRIKRFLAISLSFVTMLSLYQSEAAARPADKVITLIVLEAPDDPLSPIIQMASVGLNVAREYSNGDIEWIPVYATVDELDEFGNVLDTWYGTDLAFDTPSGRWAINHFDPLAPADSEFAFPPALLGTATFADPNSLPWGFEILGDLFIPLISGTENDPTMLLNSASDDPDPLPDEPDPGPKTPPEDDPPPEDPDEPDPTGQPYSG